MSDHSHAAHAEHGSQHDHGGVGQYMAVFLALCVLTTASFFTYSRYWPFHDTPAVGWAFMMAVSVTKATLVMLFFMHLLWETSWKYVLTIPPFIMAMVLMVLLIPDIGMRGRTTAEEPLRHMADPPAATGQADPAGGHGAAH